MWVLVIISVFITNKGYVNPGRSTSITSIEMSSEQTCTKGAVTSIKRKHVVDAYCIKK